MTTEQNELENLIETRKELEIQIQKKQLEIIVKLFLEDTTAIKKAAIKLQNYQLASCFRDIEKHLEQMKYIK